VQRDQSSPPRRKIFGANFHKRDSTLDVVEPDFLVALRGFTPMLFLSPASPAGEL
jgi:hypothetical protein